MKIQLFSLASRTEFEEYVDMYKMRDLTDYSFIPSARLSHVMGLCGIENKNEIRKKRDYILRRLEGFT